MSSIIEIISDLKFSRHELRESIDGLSEQEMNTLELYPGWTVRDLLVHVIGWDERVLQSLPLLLANRADEIEPVDADDYNQQSLAKWQGKSLAEIQSAMFDTQYKVIQQIQVMDHMEIDKRRERHGRIVTIRSYVINIIMEHDRQHAAEIIAWRANLGDDIDPKTVRETLRVSRNKFRATVEELDEATLIKKGMIEKWSIKDVIGHIADWERLSLQAAEHIYDADSPPPMLLAHNRDELTMMMAAQRDLKTLPVDLRYMRYMHDEWDTFVAKLKPDDWSKRGSYPRGGGGTIADLVLSLAHHYDEHLGEIEAALGK
ncbi:DinB family protein [Anaerolineales bacterium HSG6]|nr:DinB family protein [Anaerolineales bacterium HSG6]MDM8531531.1 DinB family protein [Anaerolineales bacterium HSG25]